MGTYSLLADENSRFSKEAKLYKSFKAHVIFNVITDGDLTFSDNQIMSSPNLRELVRRDGVVRTMVQDGQIRLAVRDPDGTGPQHLREVFEAFFQEGKLPADYQDIRKSPEIDFMQENCRFITWEYSDVRTNFTEGCERIVLEQCARQFNDKQFNVVREALREERDANDGLGRIFLQRDLPILMEQADILARDRAWQFLTRCSDAVYLSNLPKTIGLEPVYAEEHRDSFMLLRGGQYELTDFGDPYDLKPRLTAKHFTEGLNMLDIDDIAAIHASDAYREFRKHTDSENKVSDFDQLFIAYGELNRVIEDRIVTRFRELARHSPAPDPRQLRRQYGSWISKGAGRLLDVLSIASVMPSLSGVVLGWGTNRLIDAVKGKIDPERRHVDAAMHDLERAKFAAYLARNGKSDEIAFEHEIGESDIFERETIIR